jgi:tyrosine-specific transport protein
VACLALVGSLGLNALSGISSIMVTGLFLSFAGLLLPGLAHMTADPMSILLESGTSPDVLGSALHLAPIILMSLVYQNIVPTITKMLGYDRTKTTAAITLGSLIPLVMYMPWSFCVVGGGVDMSAVTGVDGLLMSVFALTTIGGSSVGSIMSLSEEFDTFLTPQKQQEVQENNDDDGSGDDYDKFSLPSVVASVGCALLAGQFFSDDLNGALKVAGSFGSPLLYGILPVIMAQRQQQQSKQKMMPGISLGLLGAASTGMVGNELPQSFGGGGADVMAMISLS